MARRHRRSLIVAAIHADISQLAAGGLSPTGDLEADLIRVVEYYSGIYEHREGLIGTLILEGARDADMAALISEPLAAMSRIGELIAGYQRAGQMLEEPVQYAVQALVAPLLMTAIMLAVVLIAAVILKRTVFGRQVLAVGGNEAAARLAEQVQRGMAWVYQRHASGVPATPEARRRNEQDSRGQPT